MEETETNQVRSNEEGAVHEAPQTQETTPSSQQNTVSSQEKNFATLRSAKERAERERDEMMAFIKEQKQKEDLKKKRAQQESYERDEIGLGEDDLVEGKHIKKLYRKLKEQEEQISQYQQQSSQSTAEARLKVQYPDFDKVVSANNIEELKVSYPELAQTLQSSPDLYTQAASAYTLIKKLGIYKEDIYKEDRARAQDNASKPKPMNSISPQQADSPLSHANAFSSGLTEDRIQQLRKMNKEARENY